MTTRWIAMRWLVASMLSGPALAHAGDFCGSEDGPSTIKHLERYGAGKGTTGWSIFCLEQSYGGGVPVAEKARIVAACTQAVQLPAAKRDGDTDGFCVTTMLDSGTGVVGTRDLVAEQIARGGAWDRVPPYASLAASGDPRVRAFALEVFASSRTAWQARKKKPGWAKDTWLRHQLAFLSALAIVGQKADLAIVDEIAAENPRNKRIAKAIAPVRTALAAR